MLNYTFLLPSNYVDLNHIKKYLKNLRVCRQHLVRNTAFLLNGYVKTSLVDVKGVYCKIHKDRVFCLSLITAARKHSGSFQDKRITEQYRIILRFLFFIL